MDDLHAPFFPLARPSHLWFELDRFLLINVSSSGSIYNPVAACRGTFGANNGLAGGEFDVHRHGRIGCSWLTGTKSSSFEAS